MACQLPSRFHPFGKIGSELSTTYRKFGGQTKKRDVEPLWALSSGRNFHCFTKQEFDCSNALPRHSLARTRLIILFRLLPVHTIFRNEPSWFQTMMQAVRLLHWIGSVTPELKAYPVRRFDWPNLDCWSFGDNRELGTSKTLVVRDEPDYLLHRSKRLEEEEKTVG